LAQSKLLDEQSKQRASYESERAQDVVTLNARTSDLNVAAYILRLSRCKASLVQNNQTASSMSFQVCETPNGTLTYRFNDPSMENSANSLSLQGKEILDFALQNMHAALGIAEKEATMQAAGLAMGASMEDREDGYDDDQVSVLQRQPKVSQSLSQPLPKGFASSTVPPVTEPRSQSKQANRCRNAKPDCGLLHDTFALLWGNMKDLVEESTQKISKDDDEWKKLNDGFNAQLETLTTETGDVAALFAEATSSAISEGESQAAKQAQQKQLNLIYKETMSECRETLRSILFTDICGTIKVRNQLISSTLGVKEMDVVDCAVTAWVYAPCSVPCDADAIGGTRLLKREVVAATSEYGAKCPALNTTMQCNQVKCPADCELSEWSSFSKCSKECGGGVQTRTRTKITPPENGGKACQTLQETQPCNTGSCDRDCTLSGWSPWGACSQACDGGKMTRTKKIVRQSRAEGTCAGPQSATRFMRQSCNVQACAGDEVCISNLDIVLAIDSSGSLTQKGFDLLKTFAEKFISKFQWNARVAVVQFGNGHLDSQGVVSDATLKLKLTDSMLHFNSAIRNLTFQRGFTNMAQAFKKGSEVLKRTSKRGAETEFIMITDGKPSFKLQTNQALQELKKIARVVIIHVKSFPPKEDTRLMKAYASSPDSENYISIPGKKKLRLNWDTYVQKALVQTCPLATSPGKTPTEIGVKTVTDTGVKTVKPIGAPPVVPGPKAPPVVTPDPCVGNVTCDLNFAGSTFKSTFFQSGVTRPEFRFSNICKVGSQDYDLLIVNSTEYRAPSKRANRIRGDFGQINVLSGTRVNMEFAIVFSGTQKPAKVSSLILSILDLVEGCGGRTEELTAYHFASAYVTSDTELRRFDNPDGSSTFKASTRGGRRDNPKDVMKMSKKQEKRTVSFEFTDVEAWHITFAVGGPPRGGRNFMMTGSSELMQAC